MKCLPICTVVNGLYNVEQRVINDITVKCLLCKYPSIVDMW